MQSIPHAAAAAHRPAVDIAHPAQPSVGRFARALEGIRSLPGRLAACVRPVAREADAPRAQAACAFCSVRNPDALGLYLALQRGEARTVAAFGESLACHDGLDSDALTALLAAQRPDGLPGLYMAMQAGHGEAIQAFGRLLAGCDLDARQLTTLLAARSRDAWSAPGLHVALQNGRSDAIRAFGELLRDPRIAPLQRMDLLFARRLDGTPGLFMAMQMDRGAAVRAFGDIAARCDLDPADLADLLDARDANGLPALAAALQMGSAYAIRAFGEVVSANAHRFDGEQLLKLLEVDFARAGSDDARRAYVDLLARLVAEGHLAMRDDLDVPVPPGEDDDLRDPQPGWSPTSSPTGRTVDSRSRSSLATASGERVYGASNA